MDDGDQISGAQDPNGLGKVHESVGDLTSNNLVGMCGKVCARF